MIKKLDDIVTARFEPGLLSFQLVSRFVIQHCKFDLLTTAPEVFLFSYINLSLIIGKETEREIAFVSSVKLMNIKTTVQTCIRIAYCLKLILFESVYCFLSYWAGESPNQLNIIPPKSLILI